MNRAITADVVRIPDQVGETMKTEVWIIEGADA